MKRVLMRTHEHRYFGKPGVEFSCPDEVLEELQRLDKRMFQVIEGGDADEQEEQKAPEEPPADKMVRGRKARKK